MKFPFFVYFGSEHIIRPKKPSQQSKCGSKTCNKRNKVFKSKPQLRLGCSLASEATTTINEDMENQGA